MKTRAACFGCALAIGLGSLSCTAAETSTRPSPVVKAADALIVRPISLGSIVVGGALFTLSLPVAALTKKVKPAADALVHKPFYRTFKRPLGDMDAMAD